MDKVIEVLKKLNIEYEIIEHAPVYTVEEAENIENMIDGVGCKNLFLKDKNNRYFLYVLNSYKKADLKSLQKKLQCGRLSFASEEELYEMLKLNRGSVSPLGIINNKECNVIVILDGELQDKKLLMHPNLNTFTISMDYDNLMKFIDYCNNKYFIYK